MVVKSEFVQIQKTEFSILCGHARVEYARVEYREVQN